MEISGLLCTLGEVNVTVRVDNLSAAESAATAAPATSVVAPGGAAAGVDSTKLPPSASATPDPLRSSAYKPFKACIQCAVAEVALSIVPQLAPAMLRQSRSAALKCIGQRFDNEIR